jgi:hypothetical protein
LEQYFGGTHYLFGDFGGSSAVRRILAEQKFAGGCAQGA